MSESRLEVAVAPSRARVSAAVAMPGASVGAGIEPETPLAGMARRLMTPRAIALTGDAQGETVFDGSRDVSIYAAIRELTNEELEEMLR